MPSYTIDPTDSSRPLDSDELQYAAEELRALKAHLASQLAALGGPLPSWGLETNNAVINGSFKVWQDGVTSNTNNTYIADMWRHSTEATGTFTVSKVAGVNAKNALSLRHSAITNAQYMRLEYYMEAADAAAYAGQEITISFSALASLGDGIINVTVGYPTADDDFSLIEDLSTSGDLAITGTIARKSYTVTLTPSTSSHTARKGLYFYITFTPDATGDRSCVIENVQFEYGATATLFKERSAAEELALCQRYFFKLINNACIITSGSYHTAGSGIYFVIRFPVTMRVAPTVTKLGTFSVTNCSQPVVTASINPDNALMQAATTVAGAALFFVPTGITGIGIKASARLK